MITVQDGSGSSSTPDLVLGYATARHSPNLVFDTLDGGIAVSIYPARPRAGVLHLFYVDEPAALAAMNLHARESTFTLTSDERDINMSYVVTDDVALLLDEDTRDLWTVDVPYQEIVT